MSLTKDAQDIVDTKQANLESIRKRGFEHAKVCTPKLVDAFVDMVKASTHHWGDWGYVHVGSLHDCYLEKDARPELLDDWFDSEAYARLGRNLTLEPSRWRHGPEKIYKFTPEPHR